MKHASSLLLAAGLAAAQTTVVSVLLPQVDQQKIDGSVISAGPTATSYSISCPPGEDGSDCGLGGGMQVLYGPSVLTFSGSYDDETIYASCSLDPAKDLAACSDWAAVSGVTKGESSTLTGYKSFIIPVTITAGADKLSNAGAAATASSSSPPTAAQTTVSTSATATDSQSGSSTTGSGSSSSSSSGGSSASTSHTSSTSTGGVPQITQNAVVMGAAALLGGAMLL